MDSPIIGGLLAFLLGSAVSGVNYAINLRTLKKKPSALASMAVVRQVLNVGCLVAVFALSGVLPWGRMVLLLGAAIGLTIPSILLSLRLAKINDAISAQSKKTSEKGGDPNG